MNYHGGLSGKMITYELTSAEEYVKYLKDNGLIYQISSEGPLFGLDICIVI